MNEKRHMLNNMGTTLSHKRDGNIVLKFPMEKNRFYREAQESGVSGVRLAKADGKQREGPEQPCQPEEETSPPR